MKRLNLNKERNSMTESASKSSSINVDWQTPETIRDFKQRMTAPYYYDKPETDIEEDLGYYQAGDFRLPQLKVQPNTIYSMNCELGENSHQTKRNNHAVILGDAPGVLNNILLPNLLQLHGSYVVMDPTRKTLNRTKAFFESKGYKTRILDFGAPEKSNHYNPLRYVETEEDAITFVKCLVINSDKMDPFYYKSIEAVLIAAILYLASKKNKETLTIKSLIHFLMESHKKEYQGITTDELSLEDIYAALKKEQPDHPGLRYWQTFKLAPQRTAECVLMSAICLVQHLEYPYTNTILSDDNIELDRIGQEKTVLYLVIPTWHPGSYAPLVSMLYSQIMDQLICQYKSSDRRETPCYNVHFLMDKFASYGTIPMFGKKIAELGGNKASFMIFTQTINQLKNMYKDDEWLGVMDRCDTLMYIGGKDRSTAEFMYDKLKDWEKQNIDQEAEEDFLNWSSVPVTVERLMHIDRDDCIVMVRGEKPFFDRRYNEVHHPYAGQVDWLRF